MRASSAFLFKLVGLALIASGLKATTLTFEGLTDSTMLAHQYAGVSFANAIVLTSGIGLNELEFPPHSGVNVASDYSGPLTLNFLTPVSGVSAYFTYLQTLTLTAYDASGVSLGVVQSSFGDNEKLSGQPGSSPNEFIQLSSLTPISSLSIDGDPNGGSFVMDDLTFAPSSIVPEVSSWKLMIIFGVVFVAHSRSRILRRR